MAGEVGQPAAEVFDRIRDTLSGRGKCRITTEAPEKGHITAETDSTWKSWGETITVDISPLAGRRTRVAVRSRSLVRTTLVDFGKNAENVREIIALFRPR